MHVSDNPAMSEAGQVGMTVWYDTTWDYRRQRMKGINLSFTDPGSVGCYGGGGGQSGRQIGTGQGGNDRCAASSSTLLTPRIARLMGYDSLEAAEKGLEPFFHSKLPPMSSMQVQSSRVANRQGVGSAHWRRIQLATQIDQYRIPDFSPDENETSVAWEIRARALLKEWKETSQRQTRGGDKSGRASPLYHLDCQKAV